MRSTFNQYAARAQHMRGMISRHPGVQILTVRYVQLIADRLESAAAFSVTVSNAFPVQCVLVRPFE